MDVAPIDRVRLLPGHVSADTAYLVADYPYGRRLRCQIRYWVETADRGAKRGQQRFVSQTTNPRRVGEPWNHPHPGTYGLRVWMYLDGNDHVHHVGVGEYGLTPATDARLRLMGIHDQLPDDDRRVYGTLLETARRRAEDWDRWEAIVATVADRLAATGTPPVLDNGTLTIDGRTAYVGAQDYPVAVALARRHTTG